MKHLRKPTIPIAPWEIPDATGDEWDRAPSEDAISRAARPVDNPIFHSNSPDFSTPASALIGRVFMGRLNVSDLDYMAKAILQMADENHELRERVRKLEEGLGN